MWNNTGDTGVESLRPYQIEVLPRMDILNYKASGYIKTEEEFLQFIHDVYVIINQSGHKKVLADCRSLEGIRPGSLRAIKDVEEAFSPQAIGVRVAVIEREENIVTMKHREYVAYNRGYTLKYFIDPAEAEAWL